MRRAVEPSREGCEDAGHPPGEALDVDLVEDRLVERDVRRPVGAPVEERADDHTLGHVGGAVVVVAGDPIGLLAEQRRVQLGAAVEGTRIRVDQQLGGVEAMAVEVTDGLLWFWIGTHEDYDKLVG